MMQNPFAPEDKGDSLILIFSLLFLYCSFRGKGWIDLVAVFVLGVASRHQLAHYLRESPIEGVAEGFLPPFSGGSVTRHPRARRYGPRCNYKSASCIFAVHSGDGRGDSL